MFFVIALKTLAKPLIAKHRQSQDHSLPQGTPQGPDGAHGDLDLLASQTMARISLNQVSNIGKGLWCVCTYGDIRHFIFSTQGEVRESFPQHYIELIEKLPQILHPNSAKHGAHSYTKYLGGIFFINGETKMFNENRKPKSKGSVWKLPS